MIYYYILIIFSILSPFSKKINYKGVLSNIYVLVILGLVFFVGFRDDVGFDNESYKAIYQFLITYGEAWNIEPLIQLLMYAANFLLIGYNGFLFLTALLAIGIKGGVIYRYAPFPFLALLLYYSKTLIGGDFGQIRQGLAMGIVLYSVRYIIEANFKKFIIVMMFAIFVHVSSIIFIPFYFLSNLKLSTQKLLIILLFTIPFSFIDFKIIFSNYLAWMPSFVATKVYDYTTGGLSEGTIGLTFSVIFRILIILFIIFSRKKTIYENKTYLTFFNIYYFGVIFYLVFNSFPQLGGRGSNYFQQFEILLFPIVIYSFKNPITRFIMFLVIIFYCYWGLDTTINFQPESFFPYKNILV